MRSTAAMFGPMARSGVRRASWPYISTRIATGSTLPPGPQPAATWLVSTGIARWRASASAASEGRCCCVCWAANNAAMRSCNSSTSASSSITRCSALRARSSLAVLHFC
eukprot:6124486-Pleurochrysis_carterae.AAC.1